MRARFDHLRRSRQARRPRALTAAIAAAALVGGVVVASTDSPLPSDSVSTVSLAMPALTAGQSFSYHVPTLATEAGVVGVAVTAIDGLPQGVTYDPASGMLAGTVTEAGEYVLTLHADLNGLVIDYPVTVSVGPHADIAPSVDTSGEATAGADAEVEASAGSEAMGSSMASESTGHGEGEGEGQGNIETGSDATDDFAGVVTDVVGDVLGQAGSSETAPDAPDTETAAETGMAEAGSSAAVTGVVEGLAQAGMGSLTQGLSESAEDSVTPGAGEETSTPAPVPPLVAGSQALAGSAGHGEAGVELDGGLDSSSAGELVNQVPLSSGDGQAQRGSTVTEFMPAQEVEVPGMDVDAGSLASFTPVLATTGLALLGIAGASVLLGGNLSVPGSTAILPALPESNADGDSSSLGRARATTKKDSSVQAPGPGVENGRG